MMHISLIVSLMALFACNQVSSSQKAPTEVKASIAAPIPQTSIVSTPIKDTISIIGVGDIMLGTNYPSPSYLHPDPWQLLAPVAPQLQDADITMGNLEGVLLTSGGTPKVCKDLTKCYTFRSPDEYAAFFKQAGFDLLSVANNHSGDFGLAGRQNTARLLQEQGIGFAGFATHPFTTIEKDGVKYGFVAFAPNIGTVSVHQITAAQELVKKVKKQVNVLIVSMHIGAEGATKNRVTRANELFVGENRGNPYLFARKVIDAGADIVLGHGPHVPRAIDLYKDRFIAYSLGNFATWSRFNLDDNAGLAPMLKVRLHADGRFIDARIFSNRQLGDGGPVPDENNGAFKEIKRLTQLDIPEAPLQFGEDGIITKKL